ncbi:ankyrin [Lophiostoma macrostomum CBS 122681]|uniref:Ankyrin n=1 Tax=Lophiostoma macrostomum CBS 122681 TaxID=1314788 RepID=A0A6A6TSX9_9PLEO|nr:ankyrin [Lophiostoma macrostomum CBS 122681]
MALQDLQDIAAFDNMWPGLSSSIVLDPCNATTMERLQLPSLHQAVLNANIDGILHGIDATFDVNARGQCGEVALHYTIYIRSEDGCHIAKQLLDLNADIFVETARPIVFGAQRSVLGKIDAGMSPLRVVIDHDRVDLLRIFLDSCGGPDNSRLWEMNTSILLLAVRYSSIRCLEFLCTDRNWTLYSKQHANDFDDRFFSPMYYACRPDILDRIYRFSPSRMILPAAGSSQKPLFAKDVHIIGLLRSVNASFQVHKENIFNVLHLVASFGAPETLRYLFSDREVSQLKDQKSEHGWTPLKDAIARGRYDCFCVLLENNVSMQGIWVGSGINHIHALHVCAVTPGPDAVRFAKAILSKDPQSIRAEDSEKCTPLHRAATYGRIELIELFVHHHAPIYAVNIYYRTPLGDAMVFRTIPAIRKLRYVLKQRCLPEISLQLPGILGRVVYPVAQLVTPGVHPTTGELRTSLYYRNGCADHPFSEASLSLLESLLKTSRQPWRFRVNFFQTAVYHPLYTSGIFSAIRMANLKAIQLMADSLEESSDLRASHLRHMFFQALDQLSLDEHHVADYHIRVLVVDCIWAKCVRLFDMTRNRRLASGKAAPYWRLYYILYGDKEHYQLGRCRQWIQDNPLQIYRGNMRFSYHAFTYEFHRWNDFRISPVVFTILLLVLLEIPTIIFLVIIAKDPLSGWQNYQTGLALLCGLLVTLFPRHSDASLLTTIQTNSMPTWTKTLRVAGVYYDSVQKTYDPLSKGRLLLNIGLCTVLLMVSTLNIWILFTGSYLWISYNRKLDDPFMQLPPWKRNLVYRFFSLCSAIIAWHVILIMLPVVLYLNHTILTFKVGKEAKRTPPINRRNDVEPRYKTFGTQQRLISFYPT